MRILVATLALLAVTPGGAEPTGLSARLDAWIAPLVDRHDLAGAVLVRREGENLIRRAYGARDVGRDQPNAPDTRFAIGSISKQFTAAAILGLRDAGRIDLEAPATRYLPAAAGPDSITLRHLLMHQSGLQRDVPREAAGDDLGALCSEILGTPPAFEPGITTSYSNAGYVVLACVVEAVTGARFERHVERTLLSPLGLSATGFWDGSEPLAEQAQGYDPGPRPGSLRPAPPDGKRRHLGADGIVSTVRDLALWTERLVGGQVLSERSTHEMLSDAGNGRGYGVGIYQRDGHRVIGHDGVTHGYTAFLEWYPDDRLIVAYAGNVRTSAFERLEDALPALVFGGELPALALPEALAPAHDRTLVGSYRVHDALVLDVRSTASGLELRGTGGYFTPLFHVDGDRFWYPAMYALIEARRDADGNTTALSWRTVHGQSFEIPRGASDD